MPTSKYEIDDKPVPSVTTIIGKFKDAGGLIRWAYNLGKQGKDYEEEKRKAANTGTFAHHMIAMFLNGEKEEDINKYAGTIYNEKIRETALRSLKCFKKWDSQTNMEVASWEVPLKSKEHLFGGTIDAIGLDTSNRRYIIDFKTSNKIFEDVLLQIAAYKILWEENYPDKLIDGGYHICRVAKDYDGFEHKYFGVESLKLCEDMFLMFRGLYDNMKNIRKLL